MFFCLTLFIILDNVIVFIVMRYLVSFNHTPLNSIILRENGWDCSFLLCTCRLLPANLHTSGAFVTEVYTYTFNISIMFLEVFVQHVEHDSCVMPHLYFTSIVYSKCIQMFDLFECRRYSIWCIFSHHST